MNVQRISAIAARGRAGRRRGRAPRACAAVAARPRATSDALRGATGIVDERALASLVQLGDTPATARLLHLVPLVHVAWTEGGMSRRERRLIEDVAAARGVRAGTPAFAALAEWLERPLPDGYFERIMDVIRAALDAMPPRMRAASARELLVESARVAAASREAGAGRDGITERELGALVSIVDALDRDTGIGSS